MGPTKSPMDFVKFITKSLLPFFFFLVFNIYDVILRQISVVCFCHYRLPAVDAQRAN